MKKTFGPALALAIAALYALLVFPNINNNQAHAASAVGPGSAVIIYNGGDPCQNPNVTKTYIPVNISAAGTTELVASTASQVVYLCTFETTAAGTSPSLQFKTGTKASTPCDTAAANQSGTYLPPSATMFKIGGGGGSAILTSAVGGEICMLAGGTTPSFQGNAVVVSQ